MLLHPLRLRALVFAHLNAPYSIALVCLSLLASLLVLVIGVLVLDNWFGGPR